MKWIHFLLCIVIAAVAGVFLLAGWICTVLANVILYPWQYHYPRIRPRRGSKP